MIYVHKIRAGLNRDLKNSFRKKNFYRDTFYKCISVMEKQLAVSSCLRKHVHQTQHSNLLLFLSALYATTKVKDVFPS